MEALIGFTFRDWTKVLARNRFAVDRKYARRAAFIYQMSIFNSLHARKERQLYGDKIAAAQVEQPVFILGHWRSGTTLLHNLIASDERFAYPNLFQTTHPHTMLFRETMVERALANAAAQNRPMDEVKISFRSPGEDEHALAILGLVSPTLAWMFPRHEAMYDPYLTFRTSPLQDVRAWQNALIYFMKKLTFRYNRPLVFKSPTHTSRIAKILEVYPAARFIHIRRDPFTVFRSTEKLYATLVADAYLHDPDPTTVVPGIIRRYADMYATFFEDRKQIPAGQFCELSYEDLVADMVGQVARIYETLCLPNFSAYEPVLRKYVDSLSGYQKNAHPAIEPGLRKQLVSAWQQCFDEWRYPTGLAS